MRRWTVTKKLDEEKLVLEAYLLDLEKNKRYPFKLNMRLGQCKVLKKDFEALPKEIWEETMKELLPNKKIEFIIE